MGKQECVPHIFFCSVSLSSLMTYEFTIKKICALHIAQTRGATKRVLEQEVSSAIVVSLLHQGFHSLECRTT